MTAEHYRVVTTQSELEGALADEVRVVIVRSDPDVWLTVRHTGSSTVRVEDSSAVRAVGRSKIEATDFSTVRAWDFAYVKASASATVAAGEWANVEAWGRTNVEATGQVTVEASGLATVEASGYTTVRASDSVTVKARESATVRAWDYSHVKAWGSATVSASGFATVEATSRVAVHLHSRKTTVTGGVVIDHTQEPDSPAAWCDWHDVTVIGGKALLYKAVRDDWTTGDVWDYQPVYAPGADLAAPDWRDDHACGGGLHFSPHTWEARSYHPSATRFVAVEVDAADLRPILGAAPKAKAPRCRVLHEVDIDGEPVGGDSDE